jgi:hypothetical protein
MNGPSLNVSVSQAAPSAEAATLEPAVQAARELSRQLADIPESAPEARHPSYGVARALALTLVDMLDEVCRDTKRDAARRRNSAR